MDPIKEAMIRDEDENGPIEERGKCPDCGGLIGVVQLISIIGWVVGRYFPYA